MLELLLDKRYYFPSDIVTGRLVVRTRKPLHIDHITISISKHQNISVFNEESECIYRTRAESPDSRIHPFQILEDTVISSGEHVFPFKFVISSKECSTARLRGSFGNIRCTLENKNSLEAVCLVEGQETLAKIPLTIFNRAEQSEMLDSKIKLSGPLCFFSKKYWYRVLTDKDIYVAGESVKVRCFPLSLVKRTLFLEARISLYEVLIIRQRGQSIVRSRPLAEVKALRVAKNMFEVRIRIPTNSCSTLTGENVLVRIALFVTLKKRFGAPVRIKKYVDVGRLPLKIPDVVELSEFEARVYSDRILTF